MSDPRAPYLPTTHEDLAKIRNLYNYFNDQNLEGCWTVTNLMVPGIYSLRKYPSTKIKVEGVNKTQRLSRLFYALYVSSIPEGAIIRHKCNNNKCIRPSHLIHGNYADNARDRIDSGPETPGKIKITAEIVKNSILPMLEAGTSVKDIAETLNATVLQISRINTGRIFADITGVTLKPKRRDNYDQNRPFTEAFLSDFRNSNIIETEISSDSVDTPCIIFIGHTSNELKGLITECGYGKIRWEGGYKLAHHVGFRLANNRWPAKEKEISHLCGNKLCTNPAHLSEVTRAKHTRYAAAQGWLRDGHLNNKSHQILTDDEIKEIKQLLMDSQHISDTEIIKTLKLTVTPACIADVRKGKTGNHINVAGFKPFYYATNYASEELRQQIHKLYDSGKKQREIAELLGRSQPGIQKILKNRPS